jgi:oligopeptide transport system permease protein
VQALIFVMALVFLAVNLVVDLLYAWIDPRIRYA